MDIFLGKRYAKHMKKHITLIQWARLHGYSERHAFRLAKEGRLATKRVPQFVMHVAADAQPTKAKK